MEWISVKERLPEHGARILLYLPDPDGVPYVVLGYYGRWADIVLSFTSNPAQHFSYADVSHWMPLPEPPVQNQTQTETTNPKSSPTDSGEKA